MAEILSFGQPLAMQEQERAAILDVVARIKRADARNQASSSPIRAVTPVEKSFQEESNLPVEFFDFFEIKNSG